MASDPQMKKSGPIENVTGKSKVIVTDAKGKSKVSMMDPKTKASVGSVTGRSMSRMKIRKQSYGFSAISGIKNVDRTSQIGIEFRRPFLSYFPTYQLEPREPFNPVPVIKMTEEFLEEYFSDYKYNKTEAPQFTMDIAGNLMRSIKAMNFNRYRIITVVTLAQRRAQNYSNAVAFLWDHQRDNCVSVHRKVQTAFIHITVFEDFCAILRFIRQEVKIGSAMDASSTNSKKKTRTSTMTQQLKPTMSSIAQRSMSRMKVRKSSYGFSDIAGVTPYRNSQAKEEYRRPILTYLNTYQLEPHVKFDPVQVKKTTGAVLDELFVDHVYNKQVSPELALRIANDILFKVKALDFNRYRIISLATIAQNRAQSYSNAVAFVWDDQRDNCVNIIREIRSAFIQVTIFGVYLD